jgi:hypothetical protein
MQHPKTRDKSRYHVVRSSAYNPTRCRANKNIGRTQPQRAVKKKEEKNDQKNKKTNAREKFFFLQLFCKELKVFDTDLFKKVFVVFLNCPC